MTIQSIYTIENGVFCPDDNEPDLVKEYLNEVFGDIAKQVVVSQRQIDWLVVKSTDLQGLNSRSSNFFEDIFERELKRQQIAGRTIRIIKGHSTCCVRDMASTDDIERWINEKLCVEFKPVYINDPDLIDGFVGYHLFMNR